MQNPTLPLAQSNVFVTIRAFGKEIEWNLRLQFPIEQFPQHLAGRERSLPAITLPGWGAHRPQTRRDRMRYKKKQSRANQSKVFSVRGAGTGFKAKSLKLHLKGVYVCVCVCVCVCGCVCVHVLTVLKAA